MKAQEDERALRWAKSMVYVRSGQCGCSVVPRGRQLAEG